MTPPDFKKLAQVSLLITFSFVGLSTLNGKTFKSWASPSGYMRLLKSITSSSAAGSASSRVSLRERIFSSSNMIPSPIRCCWSNALLYILWKFGLLALWLETGFDLRRLEDLLDLVCIRISLF